MSAEFARRLIAEYNDRIEELREEKYSDSYPIIRLLHIQISSIKNVMKAMGHTL